MKMVFGAPKSPPLNAMKGDTRWTAAWLEVSGRVTQHIQESPKHRPHLLARGIVEKEAGERRRPLITTVEAEKPPMRLVIGGDALDLIRKKITSFQQELDAWEDVTRSTNRALDNTG
ncbi:hypothetical protein [Rhizobium sp. P28RR-XV]|uniref:hypothetical protein n=1 Tax=Rhizobium sp. P28RR-XV TaxID=2726737 RepID=UPI00145773DA|nr:hypothetical protein [Rhizobium sp. P28RR-XV]NLR89121.1 hypothetical protein [Rhizobium sp. P28RR-XV]